MAFDGGRSRSMLGNMDVNSGHTPHSVGKNSMKGSRQSMIPRHSVIQSNRETVGLGQSVRGLSRPSMAASIAGGMETDGWGSHSVSNTPHRPQSLRRGESSRQSMAPPPPQATAGRASIAPTPNGRKSMGRVSLAPRSGMGGMNGKSSMQIIDPRPVREDKSYLARLEMEIQDFLVQTGFAFPAKYSGEFHMPSQALVMSAFRHLYHQCVDLRYTFSAEPKKEVEEILQLLNDIKYPLITDLSKTKLSAPGSIHNWPPICGMLHWLVCIESSLETVTTKYHGGPLERPVSAEDEDFCHYFPYLWRCYEQFWDSKDEYPEEEEKLERIFEEKSARTKKELDRMKEEWLDLEEKLKDLKENDSPLEVEEKEKAVLESDVKKFIEYRDAVLLPRIQQYNNVVEKLKADSAMHTDQIHQRTQERDRLRREVDAQEVTADDFETMSRERETLSKQLDDMMTKLHDRSSTNGHTEISLSNRQARVEDDLKTLSDQCREIDMFPFTLQDGRTIYDFEMAASNTSTLLPKGLDFRQDVKRKIGDKRDRFARQYRDLTGTKLKDQESYDLLLEEVEEKRESMDKLEMRLKSIREQTDMANAASKEENRIQAELEAKNGLAIAQIDQSGRMALDQAEARLQEARMQLTLVQERDTTLRKELHDEFVVGLENILSLKSAVSEGLKSLQETAMECSQD
ncbi:hypothetical protein L7F22_003103 [Adiantum nelumboides]|nr:hypothetical protein [Adiantum nelumboides]